MSFSAFKEKIIKKDENFLNSLSNDDLVTLKRYTLDENSQLTVPSLISLLLLESNDKKISDEEVIKELRIFDFIDRDGDVTVKGQNHLLEASTKEKVKSLLFS